MSSGRQRRTPGTDCTSSLQHPPKPVVPICIGMKAIDTQVVIEYQRSSLNVCARIYLCVCLSSC